MVPGDVALGEFSFCDATQKRNKRAPPPKYFTEEQLIKYFGSLPEEREVILKGFEIPKDGGLICTDEEALNK